MVRRTVGMWVCLLVALGVTVGIVSGTLREAPIWLSGVFLAIAWGVFAWLIWDDLSGGGKN